MRVSPQDKVISPQTQAQSDLLHLTEQAHLTLVRLIRASVSPASRRQAIHSLVQNTMAIAHCVEGIAIADSDAIVSREVSAIEADELVQIFNELQEDELLANSASRDEENIVITGTYNVKRLAAKLWW